jgi:hypothetical protein
MKHPLRPHRQPMEEVVVVLDLLRRDCLLLGIIPLAMSINNMVVFLDMRLLLARATRWLLVLLRARLRDSRLLVPSMLMSAIAETRCRMVLHRLRPIPIVTCEIRLFYGIMKGLADDLDSQGLCWSSHRGVWRT